MTLRSSDLQLDSDLDSIRNSCDVLEERRGNIETFSPTQKEKTISSGSTRGWLFYLVSVSGSGTNSCFEDNIVFFGNNLDHRQNLQPSREDCMLSCQRHPSCQFWSWESTSKWSGQCFLKHSKSLPFRYVGYVSGPKYCAL